MTDIVKQTRILQIEKLLGERVLTIQRTPLLLLDKIKLLGQTKFMGKSLEIYPLEIC